MANAPNPPPFFSRKFLLTGVAVACLSGAGAGLWARPAVSERRLPAVAAEQGDRGPAPQLQIVVDEAPSAPLGPLLEVMRAEDSTPAWTPPLIAEPEAPAPMPEVQAPARPPEGLVRVAVVEPEPEPAPPPAPKPAAKPQVEKPRTETAKADKKPKVERVVAKKAEALKAKAKTPEPKRVKVKADKASKAKLEKVRLEQTKADKAKAAKLEKAKLDKAKPRKADIEKARLQKAKLEKAEAAKLKAEKAALRARAEKAEKAEKAALAKLKLMKVKTAPQSKGDILERIEKAVLKITPAQTPQAKPAPPKVVVKAAPPPPPAPVAAPKQDEPRLTQVRNRCDADDPADVLVCENPSLQAAERQMARAYRQAEDAGVPSQRLRSQQRRWLAARSAAARDNPWAVRDVYDARIAELEELSARSYRNY